MIEETGRVVAVEDGAVWVETVRQSTCSGCSARHGCGHRLLNGESAGARARIRALCDDSVPDLGTGVVVGIPEGALVRGALMVYLLPLVLMFLGALAGALLFPGPGDLSAVLGIAGLVVGFLLNRWYSHSHATDGHLQPRVLRSAPETAPVVTMAGEL